MPWLIVTDDSDDPVKTVETLLDGGSWQPIEGGWLVTPREDPREKARARARRYRSRKRHGERDDGATVERDALPGFSDQFSGDIPHPRPLGPGGGGVSPETSRARDASPSRDGARGARDDGEPRRVAYGGPETWRVEPLTDEDRDLGRSESARLAASLRHPSGESA